MRDFKLRKYARMVALGLGLAITPAAAAENVNVVNQGPKWTNRERDSFYVIDQGSRIMPLAWIRALHQKDGAPFLADTLTRYGYLENPRGPESDLPVGFTVGETGGQDYVGMNCAACHTRQIEVDGAQYRLDGGPAIVDFGAFLIDLNDAVKTTLATDAAFGAFAGKVLGKTGGKTKRQELKLALQTWSLRFDTLVTRSKPELWGPARLDAVTMIFNRVTGLDIGTAPTFLIPDNIKVADAPTRYPFLWNAAIQDKTQWPGFAENGNDILGLARNLGEVYGVFAIFHPKKQKPIFQLDRDYISDNSANFDGLTDLEDLIWKIGPPEWPWQLSIDAKQAAAGKRVFERDASDGGCIECHGKRPGAFRSIKHSTWATPVIDVGTDSRECDSLKIMVDTGVMAGADIPLLSGKLQKNDAAVRVLATVVLGAIIQNTFKDGVAGLDADAKAALPNLPELEHLKGAFGGGPAAKWDPPATPWVKPSGCAYESRVLEGVWAAAPFLHNGSVPTLEELLKPAKDRIATFKVGRAYDIEAIGLAVEQTEFDHEIKTTGCDKVNSGESRCGHEFGVDLSDADKSALLEYMKTL